MAQQYQDIFDELGRNADIAVASGFSTGVGALVDLFGGCGLASAFLGSGAVVIGPMFKTRKLIIHILNKTGSQLRLNGAEDLHLQHGKVPSQVPILDIANDGECMLGFKSRRDFKGINGVLRFSLDGKLESHKVFVAFDVKDNWGKLFLRERNNYDIKVCQPTVGNLQEIAKKHRLADRTFLWKELPTDAEGPYEERPRPLNASVILAPAALGGAGVLQVTVNMSSNNKACVLVVELRAKTC